MHYDCEEFVATLANRIKTLRQERGWTQMQMVRDFGYYLSHWQNIESGKKMSLETMLRVANTFDVSLDELLGGIKRRRGIGFGSKGYYLQAITPKKRQP
jgi:transcriptional regulator with XRE-family HTH domain